MPDACSWEESWLGVGKTQELVSGMTYLHLCAIRAFTHSQHYSYIQYTTVQNFEVSKLILTQFKIYIFFLNRL